MKTAAIAVPTILFILYTAAHAGADNIRFQNGGTIEGIIKTEDDKMVEMDIGFGTITCAKSEIAGVDRSSPDELGALSERWEKRREELKASEADFERERQKRYEEYDKWIREEEAKRAKETAGERTIELRRDVDTRSILVDTFINDKVNATLILDTGASILVLTKEKGLELGIDLTATKNDLATLQLAGNHRVTAKMVMLKSVRIKDIEVKDVLAGILLEDAGIGLKDGLLGMTFLNRLNLKIDLKNLKMSLEKA